MIFYAFFRGRAQRIISDLESAVTHVLALLSLQYDKRRRAHAGPDRRRILSLAASAGTDTFTLMNLRGRATPHHPGIQLAPLVDVLLLL